MNAENTRKLYEKYPRLYAQHKLGPEQSNMCFGFECGDGWHSIIDALSQVISALDLDAEAYQVKEKFGGLRFYCDNDGMPRMVGAILMAEAMSDRTCEVCGTTENVTQNDGGWITTRCEACRGDDERPVALRNRISQFFRKLWEV